MAEPTVVVTGVTGFGGAYHLETFLNAGYSVIGIGRNTNRLRELENLYPQGFRGAVCSLDTSLQEFRDIVKTYEPEFLIHLAVQQDDSIGWSHPAETLWNNNKSTLTVLEAVRTESPDTGVLLTTSAAIYAGADGKVNENFPVSAHDVYTASKLYDRSIAKAVYIPYGIRILEAVVFNQNGPRHYIGVHPPIVKECVKAKLAGEKIVKLSISSLQYTRDMQHASNWADASLTISQKGVSGEAYNVCFGQSTSLETFISAVCSELEIIPEITEVGLKPGVKLTAYGDNTKLRSLGWEPRKGLKTLVKDMVSFWTNELKK